MTRSLNEVAGMIQKAARGAELPLGHADDLAAAGARLIATGGDAQEVTTALQHTTGVAMQGPVAIDAVLADGEDVRLPGCETPGLLVAMVDARGEAVIATIDGDDVILQPGEPNATEVKGPVDVPDADWEVWSALAAKTYVPATEESRLSGAGAGLSDND